MSESITRILSMVVIALLCMFWYTVGKQRADRWYAAHPVYLSVFGPCVVTQENEAITEYACPGAKP